ncbi:glycosyltransferase family 2 protein [Sungkyunkwania multivorans]|uniref:Glycosyltransferase family 2 protein n=1 Tax=Sungkyunkwania multivorans TaxID=1173618 RepID=A0ABW3D215_9FLAO
MGAEFPKISVVTPNYNQADFIGETIKSVLSQDYPNLEYIVIDGGSDDGSVSEIKKYEDSLAYWVSEKDNGMYDAINKGFAKATGDIMCWINSDDVLWEGALHYVAKVFSENRGVQWLQGYPSVIDEAGALLYQRDPVGSKFHFLIGIHKKDYSFIQQESTFWSRSLWEQAGGQLNTNCKLAADFDLWMRFFEHETLYCTRKQLAAFRKRAGQQSENMEAYLKEAGQSIATFKEKQSIFERLKWNFTAAKKKRQLAKRINWL